MMTNAGPQSSPERTGVPVFRTREALAEYLLPKDELERKGMEKALEEVARKMESQEGRQEIMESLRRGGLNGNTEKAFAQLHLNHEQLEKKEGFLKKILMLPVRGVRALGRTIKKHPILAALAAVAIAFGGAALGFYLAGEWELFLTKTGLGKVLAAMRGGEELAPLMPKADPLPGGGTFDIPPPSPESIPGYTLPKIPKG